MRHVATLILVAECVILAGAARAIAEDSSANVRGAVSASPVCRRESTYSSAASIPGCVSKST